MPAFVERDALGKRQDLSDALAVADQKKTPFTSWVKKTTAPTNTLTEWPVDTYPAVSTAGAVDEAPVSEYENINNVGAVLQGRVMIKQRAFRVSRFADRVMDQAGVGRKKAFVKAAAKALTVLKRDIEAICLGDQDSTAGTGATGGVTRGLLKWASATAQSDLPVDASYRTPSASIDTTAVDSITDNTLLGVLQSIFDQTGDGDMELFALVGSTLRKRFSRMTGYDATVSNFTAVRRFNVDAEEATLPLSLKVIDTDFGRIILRTSSFINESGDPTSAASKRNAILMPMNDQAVRLRFGWEPKVEELANDGGGRRALAEAGFVLEVGNPLWLAKFDPSS